MSSNIISVRGFHPSWGSNVFIAPSAYLIGDVQIGNNCSVWFGAVIRGDVNSIRIGDKVNIQDGAIIHCTYEKTITVIKDNVSIGHRAILHGCQLNSHVLVGMGAIIMDNALVESNTLIAAGAVVTENMVCKSHWVYAGIPAKKIKPLPEKLDRGEIKRIADNYIMYASWFEEQNKK